MPGGFKVELKGFDDVLKELDITKFKDGIQDQLNGFGLDVQQDAVQLAPVDENFLRGEIYWKPITEGNSIGVEVGCHADYAAYMEFGTRKFAAAYVATLPPDWQAFAAQYKGKGRGDYFEFLNAILDWVQRKGIAGKKIDLSKPGRTKKQISDRDRLASIAYAIALNIIRNGVKPHPFLFPAFEKNRPLLIERLKNLFK